MEEEARQQGRQEGLREGQRQALQDSLLRVLQSRFPGVTARYEVHIQREEDPARLNELIDRALKAASPEEIWPSPGS
jgi:hypothetical protein